MKLGKKLLKKAFTLVELVVVMAVIAILSAVSVAAYVGITDRTKTEADRANVSEWNTLLKVETVEGTLNNVIEVQDYFKDQGFGDADFVPRTNGYGYYYCLDNNTVYLVDDFEESFDVTYPEDTLGEVNKENSYRLNNTYCLLNSSIEGVTFSRNALVVGQDNEVGVSADPMPARVIINSTEYILSNGKITIHPTESTILDSTFSDTKLNASVTEPTAKTGLVYTGSDIALINEGITNGGTWNYSVNNGSYSTIVPTATNAGTYTVKYKLVGGTDYNDIAEKGLSVTINKATASATAPTAKTGLTYTGSAQALINAGTNNGGTWQYKVDSGSYSTNIPTATNGGTYTVYYKLVGDDNHTDIAENNFSVEIETPDPASSPLCFIANEAGCTVELLRSEYPRFKETAYSLDGSTWTTFTPSTTAEKNKITLTNIGDKVYFRNTIYGDGASNKYLYFSTTGNLSVSGNVNSMYSATGFGSLTSLSYTYCFYYLFKNCASISNFSDLVLPATTLSSYCYGYMFYGCKGLTSIPTLPATTLKSYCYYYMFCECSGLTTTPVLPATSLATYCYYYMFANCTSLTTAPELPVTSLTTHCYRGMFSGCTSLTTVPDLPATTVQSYAYYSMFSGCNSLTTTTTMSAETISNSGCMCMYTNCKGLTTVKDFNVKSVNANGLYRMFEGCTALKNPPKMDKITSVGNDGCGFMFSNSGLTVAPTLTATTFGTKPYSQMFLNCPIADVQDAVNKLTAHINFKGDTAPSGAQGLFYGLDITDEILATVLNNYSMPKTLSDSCYANLFTGCASLKTAPSLPADTLASTCYSYMFSNCSGLTKAPELAAETLSTYCYQGMFSGCTSLTTAPSLPADTLANCCYKNMFNGCTSLKIANAKPSSGGTLFFTCPSTIATNSVTNMFGSSGGSYTSDPVADGSYYYY